MGFDVIRGVGDIELTVSSAVGFLMIVFVDDAPMNTGLAAEGPVIGAPKLKVDTFSFVLGNKEFEPWLSSEEE